MAWFYKYVNYGSERTTDNADVNENSPLIGNEETPADENDENEEKEEGEEKEEKKDDKDETTL